MSENIYIHVFQKGINSKMTIFKKLGIYAITASLGILTAGCGNSDNNSSAGVAAPTSTPKMITHEELNITLPADYIQQDNEKYTFYYSNANSICLGNKEPIDDLEASGITAGTIDDYVNIIKEKSEIDTPTETVEGNEEARVFTWNNTFNDNEYTYLGYVCKTTDAYWLIQFACLAKDYNELKPQFMNYLSTVEITSIP